ncbi:MAG: hypothetical protein KKG04_02505, partial [Candidatus Thermoplasmatota archaeon]|nr:hypothetical protein [Candidatus Thermoplasmatota archaeon]
MRIQRIVYFMLLVMLMSGVVGTVLAYEPIIVDYYYSEACGSCEKATEEVMQPLALKYGENITVNYKEISTNLYYREEMLNHRLTYPSAVINNEIKIPAQNLTFDTIDTIITAIIKNLTIEEEFNESIIYIPFIGAINTSALSLPVLTITLGALDSFNPCSFFILIFLLNILLYVHSRRRMLLVGGIFIFFSGLFYFLFIFILFNSIMITSQHIAAVSLIAGLIALTIGFINIKDFFFYKSGPSLSIPESKKPMIFKKMRN